MSYTKRQREWYHRVYGHQCAFYEFVDGWVRCRSAKKLEVHHILPSRACKAYLPDFNRHSCLNGIVLCRMHHKFIHPDMRQAYIEYRIGNKESFKEMVHRRDEMVARGEPYWVTKWDWMLRRVSRRFIYRYIAKHPNDLFPKRGVRSERYGNP